MLTHHESCLVRTTGLPGSVLVAGEMAAPEPGPGEVRIRVNASGIDPGDVKKRQDAFGVGMPLPRRTSRDGRLGKYRRPWIAIEVYDAAKNLPSRRRYGRSGE
ncbi:MAG: zinc-binding alcohol dehydrogenase family protein [Anaerolineae bacterium]|nr:zinc-binding alcohol dehydrogenase family protein [Gemmatimonadaceae bacterium]